MNWQFVIMTLFGMSIFLVVTITILFYLQHRLVRSFRRNEPTLAHPTEGRYFRRFLPLDLKAPYDAKIQEFERSRKPTFKGMDYKWHALVISGAAFAVVSFAANHWHDFHRPIELTAAELHGLNNNRNQTVNTYQENLPKLDDYMPRLRQQSLVLLTSASKDAESHSSEMSRASLEQWTKWASAQRLRVTRCSLAQWANCGSRGSRWFVVLPGQWDAAILDQMIAKNETVLLFGSPEQTVGARQSWTWRDFKFEAYNRSSNPHMILKGDSILTLGFDAGLILQVNPISNRFRMQAKSADAYAIGHEHVMSGSMDARLAAMPTREGRAVWMDFSPNLGDHPTFLNREHFQAVMASVMRFVAKDSYSAVATWPKAAPFAALATFSMDASYSRTRTARAIAQTAGLPLTWFLVSDHMQRERRLTRQLASTGEVSCAADSATPLPQGTLTDQVQRLARCRKVLNEITGRIPVGIRPPEEAFNDETFDAVLNNGMKYFFARSEFDRAVPLMRKTKGGGAQFVQLPRVSSDDDQLLSALGMSVSETGSRLKNEMSWLRQIGGLYTFTFTSRYVENEDYETMILDAGKHLKESGAFFQTAQEIAGWWIARDALIAGQALDPGLMAKYTPKRLIVGSDGFLTTEDL